MKAPDLRNFLNDWPYNPSRNVRLRFVANNREIMIVRQPMGIEQYEVSGRPDGQRPHGMESALHFYGAKFADQRRTHVGEVFTLTAKECTELFEEGTLYYYRLISFLRLREWVRAERDTARNLRLLEFIKRFAEHEEDRVHLEHWRPTIVRMNVVACAMILLQENRFDEALKVTCNNIPGFGLRGRAETSRELRDTLLKLLEDLLAIPPNPGWQESEFLEHGDYWTVRYQGHIAQIKASRGMQYLASLLRHPGEEFHVSQLLLRESDQLVSGTKKERHLVGMPQRVNRSDFRLMFDTRAKADYKRRLEELREELEEAELFNDRDRACRTRCEMNCIAEHIASAVGLGGRERRTGSEAERARSAVTKRIKESISRIGDFLPSLGVHLGASVKTGYFCSYNPHPERPVTWKF